MKIFKMQLMFILLAINLIFNPVGYAAIINSSSCSQSDVQDAVTMAVDGDTVIVPSGSCLWLSPVYIPNNKKLTLLGQGIGNTKIYIEGNKELVNLTESGSRVTGFTFINGFIKVSGKNWRIDHNRFEYACTGGGTVYQAILAISAMGLGYTENIKGLIDSNQFHNMRIIAFGGPSLMANEVWSRPLGLGTDEAVYVEDNTFTYATCSVIQAMDANYGGAYVFRYNDVQDASIMAHAVQANNRATRKWEVYNNIFRSVNGASFPGFMRAGTGVWFNNELIGGIGYGTGKWSSPSIILDEQRSCWTIDQYDCKRCNGSSPWDGNQAGQSGYPCRDQIGRSTDNPKWISTPGSEGTYTQALDPAYAWNNYIYPTETDRTNKTNGTVVELVVKNDICAAAKAHIVSGRDFVNNGTAAKPGYTPYTYPHPQRQPLTPLNLKIDQAN